MATEEKIALIDRLSQTGLAKIEATSFASPKAIPNLRDAEQVMRQIERKPGVVYTVLVPNVKGCERALACKVDEINLVMSASQSHNRANLRMSCEQSLAQFAEIVKFAGQSSAFINGSLSTSFGCPFDGWVPEQRVMELVQQFLDTGIQGITLCDTTGMANPEQVRHLCEAVLSRWPKVPFTLHFHNTRGMGLSNMISGARDRNVPLRRFARRSWRLSLCTWRNRKCLHGRRGAHAGTDGIRHGCRSRCAD